MLEEKFDKIIRNYFNTIIITGGDLHGYITH